MIKQYKYRTVSSDEIQQALFINDNTIYNFNWEVDSHKEIFYSAGEPTPVPINWCNEE